jgi:SAM-dependent methyltransferase
MDIGPAVAADTARRFAADPSVEIKAGAVEDAQLGTAQFDLITSVTVLQHIMNKNGLRKALGALRTAVKPGGLMLALEIAPAWRMSECSVQPGVVERTAAEWRSLFDSCGWIVEGERRYAPWGPVLVHQYDRMVGRILGPRSFAGGAPFAIGQSPAAADRKRGLLRRSLRAVYRGTRQAILVCSWPLDHIPRLPGLAHFAYYRIFVLRPT